MISFLRQNRATLLFAGLISLMIVLMSHDAGSRGGSDIAGEILFKAGAPAVQAGSAATSLVAGLFGQYVNLRGVRAENRRLSEALLRTEAERDEARAKAAEAERLATLLGLTRTVRGPSVAARVAGSGFASGSATLLIDRGTSSGISPGMPVVAAGGVVGKVVQVGAGVSKVQCLTDPASGVAVVKPETGEQGILVGRSVDNCDLVYVPAYAELSHGDLLVTSGLDRIYPRGIPAGRIVGLPQGSGVQRVFEVRPGVDFRRISEVLVLTGRPVVTEGGEPR